MAKGCIVIASVCCKMAQLPLVRCPTCACNGVEGCGAAFVGCGGHFWVFDVFFKGMYGNLGMVVADYVLKVINYALIVINYALIVVKYTMNVKEYD